MKKLQKVLMLLLVVSLLMGVSVFTAGAVEATDVARVNGTGYATLEEAIAEAEKVGGVVELLADVDVSATISITGNVTISGQHIINRKTAGEMFTLSGNAQLILDGGVVIDGGNN